MNKVFIIVLAIIFFSSCKQDVTNTLLESYLPDLETIIDGGNIEKDSLENGNWRYTNDNNLIKSGRYKEGYKTGLWEYRINEKVLNLYWVIYEDSLIKINHPKDWRITDSKDNLFYSIINREKKDFFLIKRYNKKNFDVDLDGYFREAMIALNKKSDEKIIDYLCIKLEYKKRNAYYLRFDGEKENLKTAYYIFYTEDDAFVYDCTFKVGGEGQKLNKETFAAMVYSLGVNGDKFFHNNDEIIATTQIRIEDLD